MADQRAGNRSATDPKTEGVDRRRRGVLKTLFGSLFGLGMTALGLTGALWSAAAGRFMFPNVVTEPARRFKVGFPDDYPPDYVETRYQRDYGVWVVRGRHQGREQIFALRTVCTHLGCITIWQAADRIFKCPCHGSGFYADGMNFEGPAPRPLDRYAIRIAADGQLEVDKSRIFQEELGQWNDPASSVPV
jgi:cytochrome b6-f complex iron-sulfur subunit